MIGEIGSISHATYQPRDIIPAFSDELERLDDKGEYSSLVDECDGIDWDEEDTMTDDDREHLSQIMESLFNALNSFAPDDCYFGSHPGDGSDFGFWECDVDRA